MCGIAGIIRSDGRAVDREVLGRMAARLVHRGPDQEGFWIAGEEDGLNEGGMVTLLGGHAPRATPHGHANSVAMPPARRKAAAGLAVRRLAVIDLPGSLQPLANEDGSVRVAYNGEIYNYRDLRQDLEARGHQLRSAGDTEVLVHLYEDMGSAMLERLVGMFALALWDSRRGRLMLARDRLGQKPLYWWHGPGVFVFASEVAALLECPDVPRALDAAALGPFLRFGYVPAPATGFVGIQKLAPAHRLEFDATADSCVGPTRWWDIPRGPAESGAGAEEWRERLAAALSEAVRSQLVADVPLGVLLSGGLDSSVVTALAAAQSATPLRTFSAGFDERGWDETGYARQVARQFGTQHTEVRIQPNAVEALEDLVVRHGEPFADSSAIATYYLARETRRSVTVALSGDGGDESFGGYPRHAAMLMSESMSAGRRRFLAGIGRWMPPRAGRKSRWNALRRFLSALDLDPLPRYLAWRSLFPPHILPDFLAPDVAREVLAADPLGPWSAALAGLESRPWVDRAMTLDLVDYLPNDCLAKIDIASMRHSLEVRSPLLDHRVVELARRMPAELKFKRRCCCVPQGKAILRDLFCPSDQSAIPPLPQSVLNRKKMGFGVPVSRWLAEGQAAWMSGVLLDRGARSSRLLARPMVERLIVEHVSRRADHGERLWALLCLELWMRAFGL